MDLNFLLFPSPDRPVHDDLLENVLYYIPIYDFTQQQFHQGVAASLLHYFESQTQPNSSASHSHQAVASKLNSKLKLQRRGPSSAGLTENQASRVDTDTPEESSALKSPPRKVGPKVDFHRISRIAGAGPNPSRYSDLSSKHPIPQIGTDLKESLKVFALKREPESLFKIAPLDKQYSLGMGSPRPLGFTAMDISLKSQHINSTPYDLGCMLSGIRKKPEEVWTTGAPSPRIVSYQTQAPTSGMSSRLNKFVPPRLGRQAYSSNQRASMQSPEATRGRVPSNEIRRMVTVLGNSFRKIESSTCDAMESVSHGPSHSHGNFLLEAHIGDGSTLPTQTSTSYRPVLKDDELVSMIQNEASKLRIAPKDTSTKSKELQRKKLALWNVKVGSAKPKSLILVDDPSVLLPKSTNKADEKEIKRAPSPKLAGGMSLKPLACQGDNDALEDNTKKKADPKLIVPNTSPSKPKPSDSQSKELMDKIVKKKGYLQMGSPKEVSKPTIESIIIPASLLRNQVSTSSHRWTGNSAFQAKQENSHRKSVLVAKPAILATGGPPSQATPVKLLFSNNEIPEISVSQPTEEKHKDPSHSQKLSLEELGDVSSVLYPPLERPVVETVPNGLSLTHSKFKAKGHDSDEGFGASLRESLDAFVGKPIDPKKHQLLKMSTERPPEKSKVPPQLVSRAATLNQDEANMARGLSTGKDQNTQLQRTKSQVQHRACLRKVPCIWMNKTQSFESGGQDKQDLPKVSKGSKLLIYCHGNGEDLSDAYYACLAFCKEYQVVLK